VLVVVIGLSFFLDIETREFFYFYSIVVKFEFETPSGMIACFYSLSIELFGAR
jgi:hypothetical protein